MTEWYRALVSIARLIGNWRDPEGSKPRYCLNYKATSLQAKERLLTVSRKPEYIAKKQWLRQCRTGWTFISGIAKNLFQSFCLNETTQYHKQHAKQSTDLRVNSYIVSTRTKKLEGQRATWIPCKIQKNVSLTQIYSFPLAKPDKDKYDTRDKKQHNLQQFIKQPGPA